MAWERKCKEEAEEGLAMMILCVMYGWRFDVKLVGHIGSGVAGPAGCDGCELRS